MDIGVTGTTEGAGGKMVFVKVREVYDLETVPNKMTVISIHTPRPKIIQANFPGLLMQCKAYRPYSCDVKIACASTQPLDPLGVGKTEGSVAPEDLFNPILYKAISNVGMSQLEARIWSMAQQTTGTGNDVVGQSASVDVDSLTNFADEFPIYYGLLSNAHGWKTADPQTGLQMNGLRPLVYELLYNLGDTGIPGNATSLGNPTTYGIDSAGGAQVISNYVQSIRGNGKPVPFMNCTNFGGISSVQPGFSIKEGDPQVEKIPANSQGLVPWINAVCGCIIIPPSRLQTLFFRMIVDWTIEFSDIRPIGEVTNWVGLQKLADMTHYQNYDYSATKKALTGTDETILENDQAMVSSNVEIKKVM